VTNTNADVNATQTLIVGGDQVSGNAHFTHAPTTHAASVADPLAALAAPTGGTSYAAVNLSGNSTLTINPGVYPSITVSGNAQLTLNPGIYIVGSGGITISGNATVTGGTATGGQGGLDLQQRRPDRQRQCQREPDGLQHGHVCGPGHPPGPK
jgi:hypothetical protein